MIAACPKCAARYRIDREQLSSEGVRLRCAKCETIFRVRPPDPAPPVQVEAAPAAPAAVPVAPAAATIAAPAPAPSETETPAGAKEGLVLVAMAAVDVAKKTADAVRARGLEAVVVHDGDEAMLEVQRQLPRAVLLSADLPRMYSFQVCEIVKRNTSLCSTLVVLVGAIHDKDRYRRPPEEIYGADAYLEDADLPDGLMPILERGGLTLAPDASAEAAAPAPVEAPAAPAPVAASPVQPPVEAPVAAPSPPVAAPPAAPVAPVAPVSGGPPAAPDDNGELAGERAQAERLARIIVSDIVLYNEEKFKDAISNGNVSAMMEADLSEGRSLFAERIDPRVRGETDHLMDELLRVAKTRGLA